MSYKPKKGEVSGVELCGWRQEDGSIRLGLVKGGTVVKDWPKVVCIADTMYTLEEQDWQPNGFGWGIYA